MSTDKASDLCSFDSILEDIDAILDLEQQRHTQALPSRRVFWKQRRRMAKQIKSLRALPHPLLAPYASHVQSMQETISQERRKVSRRKAALQWRVAGHYLRVAAPYLLAIAAILAIGWAALTYAPILIDYLLQDPAETPTPQDAPSTPGGSIGQDVSQSPQPPSRGYEGQP